MFCMSEFKLFIFYAKSPYVVDVISMILFFGEHVLYDADLVIMFLTKFSHFVCMSLFDIRSVLFLPAVIMYHLGLLHSFLVNSRSSQEILHTLNVLDIFPTGNFKSL